MLFNSEIFLFGFLPIVIAAYYFLRNAGADNASLWFLLAASVLFYCFWDPPQIWVLGLSIAMNYLFAGIIVRRPAQKTLALAVAANLALLIAFKYWDFFVSVVVPGSARPLGPPDLPLGISFFTFTQIAFLVDLSKGRAERSGPRDYALFVTFFPHLIAGPLFRHNEIVPQFARLRQQVSWTAAAAGLAFFAIGLFKKVGIADHLAAIASPIFDEAATGAKPSFGSAWQGAFAYTFQLYFDFSGYSDMAIGLGLFFGLRMPVNFDSPYKATSIIDFWQRWHITLSRFLRDYLYIPLGGNRLGRTRQLGNLMAVMLLGGLWHGAGWTFVVWGGLHGLLLCINHVWRSRVARWLPGRAFLVGKPVFWAATFAAVVCGWVLFRSADLDTAGRMLAAMTSPSGAMKGFKPPGILRDIRAGGSNAWLAAAFLIATLMPNSQQIVAFLMGHGLALKWRSLAAAATVAAVLIFAVLSLDQPSEFIYFQF